MAGSIFAESLLLWLKHSYAYDVREQWQYPAAAADKSAHTTRLRPTITPHRFNPIARWKHRLLAVVFLCAVLGDRVRVRGGRGVTPNIVRMAFTWCFPGKRRPDCFLRAPISSAAIAIMIYVGGTLVLLVFGVMLTSQTVSFR